jgi:hypothetical protein
MATDTSYNGWTNYETWCVNLWLSNDQGSYEYVNEMAREAHADATGDEVMTRKEYAALQLADALKNLHEESMPEIPTGVYSDLLTSALGSVNWYEIAKSWIDDMEFDDDDQDDQEE